ncbi:hypothetical protein [Brevibacillus porteri]|uniref:hypothetical protein n=1 Tax=Brevibacillus porteri TaxID=2126350 RepID=UPI0036321DB1
MSQGSKWTGDYNYKGFVIWNAGEKEWVAEPEGWDVNAIENLKYEMPQLETIAAAKKWVREIGVKLNAIDYK